MKPVENIYFILAALVLIFVIVLVFLAFRKRRGPALIIASILVLAYVSFYIYYPYFKKNIHADRYEKLTEYLAVEYPDREFMIVPEKYEEGIFVGHFMVNEESSPELGVELKVDRKGRVHQTSSWSNYDNLSQEEVYRSLVGNYFLNYSLEDEIPEVKKIDQFIDGSLTAFAVTINENPFLAIFNYTEDAYSLEAFKEGEAGNYTSLEHENYIFVYAEESFPEDQVSISLEGGDQLELDLVGKKGSLLIENNSR